MRVHAIGEQQPKRTRSGAAAEVDAIEEQQLHMQADANGEQQLKRTQSGSSSSAQRAVRRGGLLTVGEQGGSS